MGGFGPIDPIPSTGWTGGPPTTDRVYFFFTYRTKWFFNSKCLPNISQVKVFLVQTSHSKGLIFKMIFRFKVELQMLLPNPHHYMLLTPHIIYPPDHCYRFFFSGMTEHDITCFVGIFEFNFSGIAEHDITCLSAF